MVVLIDSGMSHNFVSAGLSQHIVLIFTSSKGYGVLTGLGITVAGQCIFREVELKMQGYTIFSRF